MWSHLVQTLCNEPNFCLSHFFPLSEKWIRKKKKKKKWVINTLENNFFTIALLIFKNEKKKKKKGNHIALCQMYVRHSQYFLPNTYCHMLCYVTYKLSCNYTVGCLLWDKFQVTKLSHIPTVLRTSWTWLNFAHVVIWFWFSQPGPQLGPTMPIILTCNFYFWWAKTDNLDHFIQFVAHFGPLLTNLNGHSSKNDGRLQYPS